MLSKTKKLISPSRSLDVVVRSISSEIVLNWLMILVISIAAWFLFSELILGFLTSLSISSNSTNEYLIFTLVTLASVYSIFVYFLTRHGYLYRLFVHKQADSEQLNSFYSDKIPSLTILVPSYKEDTGVIKQTLLSAALQAVPNKSLVLLIDDPQHPQTDKDFFLLEEARKLPDEINSLLEPNRSKFDQELQGYHSRKAIFVDVEKELINLAALNQFVSEWFQSTKKNFTGVDHAELLFIDKVFCEPAREYAMKANSLEAEINNSAHWDNERLLSEYIRLYSIFSTNVSSFERKRYGNLSHEANKAMNLNSYIALMGGYYKEKVSRGAICLDKVDRQESALYIHDPDYIITLDADSILCHEYALKLIWSMEQPSYAKTAVIQTPYNSFPNAPKVLERIAGATTDIQYIIHQGFTHFHSTYWVGANALLRKRALNDIVVEGKENGYVIKRYIQDRTVIEDTESSVDLISHGWSLYNFPERLAYSATPPDFGSLIIQRERWANGGLIILPKLLRYLITKRFNIRGVVESLVQVHYLISIATTNVGILILLLYPFEIQLRNIWIPIIVLSYLLIYAKDLITSGYKKLDILRVMALSLLLLPVNLTGVAKSIGQGVTGKKIPFKRTPKILDRTSVPPSYLLFHLFFTSFCVYSLISDINYHRWFHAAFSLTFCMLELYAIFRYIGFQFYVKDLSAIKFSKSIRFLRYKLI